MMEPHNILKFKIKCPICRETHWMEAKFQFGKISNRRYEIGDAVIWSGKEPESGYYTDIGYASCKSMNRNFQIQIVLNQNTFGLIRVIPAGEPFIKHVGHFVEFEHSYQDGGSIHDCVSSAPFDPKVLAYLNLGIGVISIPTVLSDVLDPRSSASAFPGFSTDGTWCWPTELSYYVKKYNIMLPQAFLAHMQANNWVIPEFDLEELYPYF